MGWQRGLAAGRWRHALLRLSAALCLRLQWLLSALDDRALAAHFARHQSGIAQSSRDRRLANAARWPVRLCKRTAHHLLWGCAGQRDPRRSAWRRWLLLSSALDRLET